MSPSCSIPTATPKVTARGPSLSPLRKRLVGKALADPQGAPPGLFNYLRRRSVPFSMLPPMLGQRVCALAHSTTLASMGSTTFAAMPVIVQLKKVFYVAHAMAVDELDTLAERQRLFQLQDMQARQLILVRMITITARRYAHSPSPLRHSWTPSQKDTASSNTLSSDSASV
ncbi:hypothetical protein AURDEDRAFT_156526 [Auricularia subglabra TFB-10046 SS5]|nr:hypothetical protein AURDEDRAFT_156526 [Auricularia subglabra TFB-10046 SS5]